MVKSEGQLLIEAVVRAVVAIVLVSVIVYSVVAGVPVSADVVRLVYLLLAAYFGFKARLSAQAWGAARKLRQKRDG